MQHQLLSLPAWSSLSPSEQALADPCLYECARNAALLYCNAVVRPVLPGSKGVREPIRRLRQALGTVPPGALLGADCNAIVLWCLVMGSLGSYSTEHWAFFVTALRDHLEQHGVGSVDETLQTVRTFVWSDNTCRRGLEVVWGTMYG